MERDQAIRLMQRPAPAAWWKEGSDLFITAGFSSGHQGGRRNPPAVGSIVEPEQSAGLRPRHHERPADQGIRFHQGVYFAIAPPGIGRFRVSAFVQQGLYRRGAAYHQRQDSDLRGTRSYRPY